MKLEIYPNKVFKTLLWLIVALLFINILGLISKFYFDQEYVYGLVPLFDLEKENNIPTFYSAFGLLFASFLLCAITFARKNRGLGYLGWFGLAIIFLFLSIDEITSLHERLSRPLRGILDTSGLLFSAWVIPYGVAVLVFAAVYLKFLMNLPKRVMFLFIVSGCVYVSGALGLELLEGYHYELYGSASLIFVILCTMEEFLEMLGIVLFIHALLTYMVSEFDSFTITVSQSK
jgi:hypothetical protein